MSCIIIDTGYIDTRGLLIQITYLLHNNYLHGILYNALRSCSALFTLQVMCLVYGSCYMCLKSLCMCVLCFASLVYLVMNVHIYVHICVTIHISKLYSMHKKITK